MALDVGKDVNVYHEAWSHQLADALCAFRAEHPAGPVIRYRLLHPTLVKRARQNKSHRTRKSDAIDAAAMSDLLAEGGGRAITPLQDAEWEMRHTAGALYVLIKEQKRQAVHLLPTVSIMGETERLRNLGGNSVQGEVK